MDFKKCVQSKHFKIVVGALGTLFVALLIFQAGIFVGYHKAAFSYGYGDNYYRMFGERHEKGGATRFDGMMGTGGMMGRGGWNEDFTEAHGVIGKIVKIELPNIIVEGTDAIEKIILVTPDTTIRQFRDNIAADKLQVGNIVMIIGSPNAASQIEAKYVRLMPPSMQSMMWGTSTDATTTAPRKR